MRALRAVGVAVLLLPALAYAGPPYLTDDPEPVDYGHWEIYGASQSTFSHQGGLMTLPHVEVNHGALPELQLHAIVPFALAKQGSTWTYGPSDVELGAKWRFLHESKWLPQIGTFPLLEVPVGSASRGLGAGAFQLFVPIWLQKSFGPWTTYGGGGSWFLFGPNHTQWWFLGWMLQRQLNEHLSLGAELFYDSPQGPDTPADLRFNVGAAIDVTEHHHILLSVGRAIVGDVVFQHYVAYQLTF